MLLVRILKHVVELAAGLANKLRLLSRHERHLSFCAMRRHLLLQLYACWLYVSGLKYSTATTPLTIMLMIKCSLTAADLHLMLSLLLLLLIVVDMKLVAHHFELSSNLRRLLLWITRTGVAQGGRRRLNHH